jgi:hypothetical protein
MQPAVDGGSGAVGHHIQQPATLQVDQPGDPPGWCQAGGLEEAGLVQAERDHPLQASSVIYQRDAVLTHDPHHGRPTNAEVTGDCGDCVGVLADPPTRLGAGPLGQHRPRPDRRHPLGPGPHPAGRLTTAPDPLAPGQHHWAPTDRQVTHPDPAAAVELGPHPTTPTADHGGCGLDLELPLTGRDLRGQDRKAVQAEQLGG